MKRHSRDDLTPVQREGLYRAGRQLADMFFADPRRLARREVTFAEIDMAEYLPRKHLSRHNLAFEGWDFEMLFDPAYDGVDDSVDPRNEVVNLHFDEWFKPFNDDRVYTRTWTKARATRAVSCRKTVRISRMAGARLDR